jgi:DNA-binding NarL/FixJ family response regulator
MTNANSNPTKIRVLLVDDHDVVRKGVASLINAEPDLEVCGEADSVDSAMQAIAQTQPNLVLVDMSLKHSDGLDLLQRMKAQYPDIIAMVLSMYDETIYAERSLRAGAKGYVRKVELAETIMKAIRRVLAGQVYVSDSVSALLLQRMSGAKSRSSEAPAEALSDRELQVVRCIGRGLSNREIAEELFISVKTVESHREHIKQRLNLASSGDLLRYAIEFCRVDR